jgi:WD40 repeat protein
VTEWRALNEGALNALERAFVDASTQLRDREQRAARRRVQLTLAGLVAALAVIASVAAVALVQRSHARDSAAVAEARTLAATANAQLPVDPRAALRLAVQSMDKRSTVEGREALRAAFAEAPTYSVRGSGVTLSPDGDLIIVFDGTRAMVRDSSTGRRLAVLAGYKEAGENATFSPDGRLFAGSDGTDFYVWATRSGRRVAVLPTKRSRNLSATRAFFSPLGDLLATSEDAGTAVWNTRTWKRIRFFPDMQTPENKDDNVFSADGRRLALENARRESLFEFDTRTWRRVRLLKPPHAGEYPSEVTYGPDGRFVAIISSVGGGLDSRLEISSESSHRIVRRINLVDTWDDARFSRGGRLFALFGYRHVTIWRTRDWMKVLVRPVDDLNADWTLGSKGRLDGTTEIVDMATGQTVALLYADRWSVVFSPRANRLVAAPDDTGNINVWNEPAPEVWGGAAALDAARSERAASGGVCRISSYGAAASIEAVSADRSTVAISDSCAHEGTFELWRRDRKPTLVAGDAHESGIAFSPDGRFFAAASDAEPCEYGCSTTVWSTSSGRRVATFEGASDGAWSPDGNLLAVWAGFYKVPRVSASGSMTHGRGDSCAHSTVLFPVRRLALTASCSSRCALPCRGQSRVGRHGRTSVRHQTRTRSRALVRSSGRSPMEPSWRRSRIQRSSTRCSRRSTILS